MSKTAMIRARTEQGLKDEASDIFGKLGLSCSEAINLFFRQVILRRGLPFAVEIPNRETRKAMHGVMAKKGLRKARNIDDLYAKLKV